MEEKHPSNFIDMTGWKMWEHGVPNSKLIVVEYIGTNKGKAKWKCICSCPDKNEVIVTSANLRNGNTLSCGCYHKEKIRQINISHGESKSRLYKIWSNMKSRCFVSTTTEYENYGGRGIVVCDEWKNSYESFRDWALLNGYNDNLTIERIDVNGNYDPSNCTWKTISEQQNNKQNNHIIEYNGEKHTVSEWARIIGIKSSTLLHRIYYSSMSEKEAIELELNSYIKKIEYNGETHTIKEWSDITGISISTLKNRLYRGWSKEKVFNTEIRPKEKTIEFNGEIHNIKEWSDITGIRAGTIAYRFRQGWATEDIFRI